MRTLPLIADHGHDSPEDHGRLQCYLVAGEWECPPASPSAGFLSAELSPHPPPPAPSVLELPYTGSPDLILALIAGTLIAAGTALLRKARTL